MLRKLSDGWRVLDILEGSAAHRAGLGFGMRLKSVDGLDTDPMGLEEIVARIKGPPDTVVTLGTEHGFRNA